MALDIVEMRNALAGEAASRRGSSTAIPSIAGLDAGTLDIYKKNIAPRLGELPPEDYQEPPGLFADMVEGAKSTPQAIAEFGLGLPGAFLGAAAEVTGRETEFGKSLSDVSDWTTKTIRDIGYLGNAPAYENLRPGTKSILGIVNWPFEKLFESGQWWEDTIKGAVPGETGVVLGKSAKAALVALALAFGPEMLRKGTNASRSGYTKLKRILSDAPEKRAVNPGDLKTVIDAMNKMNENLWGGDIDMMERVIKSATPKGAPIGELPEVTPRKSVISIAETGTLPEGATGQGYKWSPEGGYTPEGPTAGPTVEPPIKPGPTIPPTGGRTGGGAAAKRAVTTGEQKAMQYSTDTVQIPGIVAQPMKDLKSVLPKMKIEEIETLVDAVDSYVENNPGTMKGVLKKKYEVMKKELEERAPAIAEETVTEAPAVEPVVEPVVKSTPIKSTINRDMMRSEKLQSVKNMSSELNPVYDIIEMSELKRKKLVTITETIVRPGEPVDIPPTWHDGVVRYTAARMPDGTLEAGDIGSYDSVMMRGHVAAAKTGPIPPGSILYVVDHLGVGSWKGTKVRIYRALPEEAKIVGPSAPETIKLPAPAAKVTSNPVLDKILSEEGVETPAVTTTEPTITARRSILRKKGEAPETGAAATVETTPVTEVTEVTAEKSKGKQVFTITPESQAKKYGIKYIDTRELTYDEGPKEVVHRFYDPVSDKYFNTDSLKSIKNDMADLRAGEGTVTSDAIKTELAGEGGESGAAQEVAAIPVREPKYKAASLDDYIKILDQWNKGDTTIDINELKSSIVDHLNKLNPRDMEKFPTNQDYLSAQERGDKVLGWINKEMNKRGQIPVDEETMIDKAIETARTKTTESKLHKSKVEFEKTLAKATEGNLDEPKKLTKAERLKLLKNRNELIQEKVLRDEVTTRSLEEGESLSGKLPEEYRDIYDEALAQQLEAVEGSEPRGLGEIARDVYTLISDEEGSVGPGPRFNKVKVSNAEVRLALQRLISDAKRLKLDLADVLRRNGFTDFEIMLVKRTLQQMREVTPEDSTKPRNTGEIVDPQGNPIVKQRKIKGLEKIPVRASEVSMIQNISELKFRKFGFLGTSLRVFESLGQEAKQQFYYDYRKRVLNIKNAQDLLKREVTDLRGDLTRKELGRVGAYSYAQQPKGAGLVKKAGMEVPTNLTAREAKLYSDLRSKYDTLKDKINEVRKLIGQAPLEEIDNYTMFARSFNILEDLGIVHNPVLEKAPLVNSTYIKHSQVPFKYSILRKKTGLYPIELDPVTIYDKYASASIRHMEMSPLTAKVNELVNTKLPDPKTGKLTWMLKDHKPIAYSWLNNWNNFISGMPSFILPRVIERPLAMLTNNLATSILGASVRSTLIQPTSLINTVAEVGPKHTINGIKMLLSGEEISAMEKSLVIPTREFDVQISDIKRHMERGNVLGAYRTIGSWSLKGLSTLDLLSAKASWYAGYEKAIKTLHMSVENAVNYADDVVVRTQASALAGDLAPIQRSTAGKAATLFQTFVINNWEFLTSDVLQLGKGIPITDKARMKKVATFVGATIFFNILYEDLAGIKSPSPTPINELIRSQEEGLGIPATVWNIAKEFIEPMPIVGSAKYGKGPGGPVLELMNDLFEKATDQPLQQSWPEIIGKLGGVPGTTQVGKFRRGQKRGEGLWGSLVGTYRKPPKKNKMKGIEGGTKGISGL